MYECGILNASPNRLRFVVGRSVSTLLNRTSVKDGGGLYVMYELSSMLQFLVMRV